MGEKLMDSDLAAMLAAACECRPFDPQRTSHSHDCDSLYFRAVVELRARRAADLSDEDREALASLRSTIEIEGRYGSKVNRALAALDKILGAKP